MREYGYILSASLLPYENWEEFVLYSVAVGPAPQVHKPQMLTLYREFYYTHSR